MFKLFGKKKEAPKPQTTEEQGGAYKAISADFDPEERSILAVTDSTGLAEGHLPDSTATAASVTLTAWMDEDSLELHQESIPLLVMGDDRLLSMLRNRIPRNFILKFTARISHDGKRMLLTNLPEPGFDPDLKAILEEQKKPVSTWIDGLGTFTLNRMFHWFQTEVDWLDGTIQLCFSQEEDQDGCVRTARALMEDVAGWDRKVRASAGEKLPEQIRAQLADSEAEDLDEITAQSVADGLELESVEVLADGGLRFWGGDAELLWSGARISGSLTEGITDAQLEG